MMTTSTQRFRDLFAGRHEPENMKPMAIALWRALLLSACVGVVGFLFYGLWVFWGVIENLNAPYATLQPTPTPVIDRMKLRETLNQYQSRQVEFESIRTTVPSVVDPSR